MRTGNLRWSIGGLVAASVVLMTLLPSVSASQLTATSAVSATVQPGCTAFTASDLDFGIYDPAVEGAGLLNLDVTCSDGVPWKVYDNGGSNFGGANRYMQGPALGNVLSYRLCNAPDCSQEWVPGNPDFGTNGTGSASWSVYGRIPSGQDMPAGDYTDSLLLTLTF